MIRLLSYNDLIANGIIKNRTTLGRWIASQGFPPGTLIGPNTRRWDEADIEAWLASRSNTATAA